MVDSKLTDYTVRESARARSIRVTVSLAAGVVVVIPRGFDRRRVPEVMAVHGAWLARATARLEGRRRQLAAEGVLGRPEHLHLRAVGRVYRLSYRTGVRCGATLTKDSEQELTVTAPHEEGWRDAARCWLQDRGREWLVPWLQETSDAQRLPVRRVAIRGQKTRWGSCSHRGTVSLNYMLLFFPPAVARYVMLHELCHTLHPNHSRRFWAEVASREPDYRALAAELRQSWRYVPTWLIHGGAPIGALHEAGQGGKITAVG